MNAGQRRCTIDLVRNDRKLMLRGRARWTLAALAIVGTAWPVAGASSREGYRLRATHVEDAPVIDGRLTEEVWQLARVVDQFTQQEPREGEAATERTEVRLLYDADHLFIGVRALDSNAAGLIATEMRRDSNQVLNEDNFQIIIDTFNDSRSGYMFVTNPLGAKLEQQIFEEGEGTIFGASANINRNWDGVWTSWRAAQTRAGWLRLPFRCAR